MGDKLYRIALTGAPGAGKSTSIEYVKDKSINEVQLVPEAATLLLAGGYPVPDPIENPWTEDWQWTFQEAVAQTQLSLEKVYEERARRLTKKILLYDRGVIDGASFLPNGIDDLVKITKTAEVDMLERYDQVIYLTGMNVDDHQLAQSNPHRLRDQWQSQRLEDKTLEAWKNHPNLEIVTEQDRHRGEIILEIIQARID